MTTLQEAVQKFIEATKLDRIEFEDWPRDSQTAFEALRTALAQQELPQKERPDFMAGYDAGMADAKRMAQQGGPVCAGCGIPAGDVHMSTCKSGKWPSRVSNGDTAAPAPQAQDKSDNYLSGYCTGRTDLLKEQSAQPVAQPLTDKRISWLWGESHNDTTDRMAFQVFARAIEAAHGITEKARGE